MCGLSEWSCVKAGGEWWEVERIRERGTEGDDDGKERKRRGRLEC